MADVDRPDEVALEFNRSYAEIDALVAKQSEIDKYNEEVEAYNESIGITQKKGGK